MSSKHIKHVKHVYALFFGHSFHNLHDLHFKFTYWYAWKRNIDIKTLGNTKLHKNLHEIVRIKKLFKSVM